MITMDQVRAALPVAENIVILEQYPDGTPLQGISVDDFVSRFGTTDLTYAALSAHPNAVGYWQTIFARWKTEGLLS